VTADPFEQPLPIARYRFAARVSGNLGLPDFAGSLLRGAFGAALRRSTCMTDLPRCPPCPLYRTCPYPALFETPPRETPLRQQFSQVPNPYVIEPPALGTRAIHAGELLEFNMVLIGHDALKQLPLVVHAWQRALRHGLGRDRVPAELEQVSWVGEDGELEPVLDAHEGRIDPHDAALNVPPPPEANALQLCIATPMRLQQQGRPLTPGDLTLRALATTAARRVSLALHLHCAHGVLPDINPLLESLTQLSDDRSDLEWHDWTRYSSRQKQEMTLGGVVGRWTIHGETAPLWPWLWLGQWLHIGKNATMGMGAYQLIAQ
jgi:hypothetical protein